MIIRALDAANPGSFANSVRLITSTNYVHAARVDDYETQYHKPLEHYLIDKLASMHSWTPTTRRRTALTRLKVLIVIGSTKAIKHIYLANALGLPTRSRLRHLGRFNPPSTSHVPRLRQLLTPPHPSRHQTQHSNPKLLR